MCLVRPALKAAAADYLVKPLSPQDVYKRKGVIEESQSLPPGTRLTEFYFFSTVFSNGYYSSMPGSYLGYTNDNQERNNDRSRK